MARYLSAGTLKELLIRVARKEMTYEEMSSKVQNEVIKNLKETKSETN